MKGLSITCALAVTLLVPSLVCSMQQNPFRPPQQSQHQPGGPRTGIGQSDAGPRFVGTATQVSTILVRGASHWITIICSPLHCRSGIFSESPGYPTGLLLRFSNSLVLCYSWSDPCVSDIQMGDVCHLDKWFKTIGPCVFDD